ncbi:hypothetical protein K9U40_07545 [Xanthobacter autotrophicus]|uniref:hypothetical protein n=1 Tax=Xanthobacter TaxID=279 RepID=UPI0024AB53E4|nr:hypothetical protein [Xanthobacter autotrophicus]MDI4664185.1 hypothetical protein [Xanthobacter autotrophicus]
MSQPDPRPAPAAAPLALKLAITLGLLANAGLAILLIAISGFVIAISGFVFGAQEGANGEASAVAGWGSTLAISVLAPILGLMMWRRGRRDLALAMVWLPPLALLVGALVVI